MASQLQQYAASRRSTPVSEPLHGRTDMVRNSTGGFTFEIDDKARLRRFLILGTESNTYYATAQKLTKSNAAVVARCIATDPASAVANIVDVSRNGLAPRNDQALFALAMCLADPTARKIAAPCIRDVARTGTHLFQLLTFGQELGMSWGPVTRRAISQLMNESTPDWLALQSVKYRQRDGWTWRDVLRLAHVKPATDEHAAIVKFMSTGAMPDGAQQKTIEAFLRLQGTTDPRVAAQIIRDARLPWETVPDALKSSTVVWEALLESMPVGAMVRQLPTLTRNGVIAPLSDGMKFVVGTLSNADKIQKARLHPIALADATLTYQSGGRLGRSRGATYQPVAQIVDVLGHATQLSFKSVTPTGKNFYLGLDISGSMAGGLVGGTQSLTPMFASAVMATATHTAEPWTYAAGFTATSMHRFTDKPVMQPMTLSTSLPETVKAMQGMMYGATMIAAPMLDAIEKRMNNIDAFVIYTDNEVNCGIHPVQALDRYRQYAGRDTKLIVCAMTATKFTVADPTRRDMLDIAGLDSSAPSVISNFALNGI